MLVERGHDVSIEAAKVGQPPPSERAGLWRTRAAQVSAGLLLIGAFLWSAWAIVIPFEDGVSSSGPVWLCIGMGWDIAQQAVALLGLGLAGAAMWASAQNALRKWTYFVVATAVTFGIWKVGTTIAANANC